MSLSYEIHSDAAGLGMEVVAPPPEILDESQRDAAVSQHVIPQRGVFQNDSIPVQVMQCRLFVDGGLGVTGTVEGDAERPVGIRNEILALPLSFHDA